MGKGILATSIMPRVQFGIMKLYRCVAENKMKAEFEDGCKGADSIRVSEEGSTGHYLSIKHQEIVKHAQHNFPEPKMIFPNCRFCPTDSPKSKDILLEII